MEKYTKRPISDGRNLDNFGICVNDGFLELDWRSQFKYNKQNVAVLMDLLLHLVNTGSLSKSSNYTMTIMTPYSERRSVYVKELVSFAVKHEIPWRDIVKVSTVDSMQGHESDFVILDWVVTHANSYSDFGIHYG